MVGIIVFTKKGVWGKKIQAELDAANNRYWKYFDKLAGYTAQNVFGENSGFRWNRWGNVYMIYGNTGLVYVNLDQDLLVAYSKSDIKEVNRERVHTGSHTSSNTVGVGAAHNRDQSSFINSVGVATDKISSDTQELYEWHLDVMSDFLSIIAFSGIIAGASFASNLGWLSA